LLASLGARWLRFLGGGSRLIHRLPVAGGDQLPGPNRLGPALVGQVDVDPSGELVAGIPLTLAVAQQNKR
jgi:hypothetical protein